MNLKERGVTVGDILIFSIIIISTIFIINKVNNSNEQSYLDVDSKVISTIVIS